MGHQDREGGDRDLDVEEMEETESRLYIPLSMRARILLLGALLMIVLTVYTTTTIEQLVEAAPPLVEASYQVLFLDEFNTFLEHPWIRGPGAGTVNTRNGSLFLNITTGGEAMIMDPIIGNEWLHVGLEIRLRCSDDNKIRSDFGGGIKIWGLADQSPNAGGPHNALYFRSLSPESHPNITGFYVISLVNQSDVYMKNITEVDITQWHTYTILWDKENAIFMIDNKVIGQTDNVPSRRQRIMVLLQSGMFGTTPTMLKVGGYYWSNIDLEHDVYLEIDYVKVYTNTSHFENWNRSINQSFDHAKGLILEAESLGINTTQIRTRYVKAQDFWRNNSYRPQTVTTYLETIDNSLGPAITNYDEILNLFSQAEELVQRAPNPEPLRQEYDKAREAWQEPDYDMTKMHLERMLQEDQGT